MYWVTGVLGLVLAAAPFIFGYADNTAALWTSLFVGGATMVVSSIEAVKADREQWEYWAVGVLGLAAIIAPFAFGFSTQASAMWTSVATGVLIVLFAGSKLSIGQWKKT